MKRYEQEELIQFLDEHREEIAKSLEDVMELALCFSTMPIEEKDKENFYYFNKLRKMISGTPTRSKLNRLLKGIKSK